MMVAPVVLISISCMKSIAVAYIHIFFSEVRAKVDRMMTGLPQLHKQQGVEPIVVRCGAVTPTLPMLSFSVFHHFPQMLFLLSQALIIEVNLAGRKALGEENTKG